MPDTLMSTTETSIQDQCAAAMAAAVTADADRAFISYLKRLSKGTLEPGASLSEELTNAVMGRSKSPGSLPVTTETSIQAHEYWDASMQLHRRISVLDDNRPHGEQYLISNGGYSTEDNLYYTMCDAPQAAYAAFERFLQRDA